MKSTLSMDKEETHMANPVGWFEITGKDGKKLQDFYSDVFGWKIDANNPMNYGVVDNEGQGIGGGISGGDGSGSQVTFYIAVDNPQAYLDRVESQGGKTVVPVTEIPGMVIFAQFADPEGNVVGLTDSTFTPQQS
jgi:predicted enzyme related to lactoylglutathione lyase